MSLGERIGHRLAKLGMSQAELARRVKLTQPTINGLVKGKSTSSVHLHLIARELKTTVAYLTGETDNAMSDQPDDMLTSKDREDIALLQRLPERDRDAIRQLMRTITDQASAPTPSTLHSPSRSFGGRDLSKGEAA